jgi:hypothetical protein
MPIFIFFWNGNKFCALSHELRRAHDKEAKEDKHKTRKVLLSRQVFSVGQALVNCFRFDLANYAGRNGVGIFEKPLCLARSKVPKR